jgi:hypothetical protein
MYEIQYTGRRDRSMLVEAVTKYQQAGKRNRGRTLKRFLDCYVEAGMDHKA